MYLTSFVRNDDWDQKNVNIAWMVGENGPEIKEYYKVYRLPTIQGLEQQPEKSL